MICAGSLIEKQEPLQAKDGGSTPTPALQFKFGLVKQIPMSPVVRDFVESRHYSKTITGLTGVIPFGIFNPELAGVILFGTPAFPRVAEKYCPGNPKAVIELRRMVLIDETPKNTESFFIAKALKWLRQNTDFRFVLSYSDPRYGHSGVVYKATGFQCVGRTAKKKLIIRDGYVRQTRALWQRDGAMAADIKEELRLGVSRLEETPPKFIYLLKLR